MPSCWSCRADLPYRPAATVPRESECPSCGRDLHCLPQLPALRSRRQQQVPRAERRVDLGSRAGELLRLLPDRRVPARRIGTRPRRRSPQETRRSVQEAGVVGIGAGSPGARWGLQRAAAASCAMSLRATLEGWRGRFPSSDCSAGAARSFGSLPAALWQSRARHGYAPAGQSHHAGPVARSAPPHEPP